MLWFSTLEKYNISDNWCKGDTSEIQKNQLNIVITFSYICYCHKRFKKLYRNVPFISCSSTRRLLNFALLKILLKCSSILLFSSKAGTECQVFNSAALKDHFLIHIMEKTKQKKIKIEEEKKIPARRQNRTELDNGFGKTGLRKQKKKTNW